MSLLHRLFGTRHLAPPPRTPIAALRPEPQFTLVPPGEAFTPTQPKSGRRRLVGRQTELRRILQTLQEDHAHVVLFSERGRGKTSLANLAVEALRRAGGIVARYTCDAGTTFDSLMRGLMHDLPPSLLAVRLNDGEDDGCGAALPAGTLRPRDIVTLPQRLACRFLVCVIDEFDRVQDPETRTKLADTIKQLSDRDVKLLFLIVGVSEDLDQILGQHPSIQRSVTGVHLPLFTDREVAQLILKGGRETGLSFSPEVVARVTVLARGMPYMAQLLGLRLAQAATARGDGQVSEEDFEGAVARLIEDASPHVLTLYAGLTDYGRDPEMVHTLRRLATAPQDAWGRMQVMPAVDGAVLVGGRPVAAAYWRCLHDAEVLRPYRANSDLFLFAERGLLHHALLLAARDMALEPPDSLDAQDAYEAPSQDTQAARVPHPSISHG